MSYDLMVFLPEAAPRKRAEFLAWYDAQTEWPEEHDYDDASLTAPPLQAFFAELSADFAPVADDAPAEVETGADYTIGKHLIYISFLDWDKIDQAHEAVYRLAAKHALGFFDVSSDLAEVWLPDRKEELRVAHSD